MSIPGAMDAGRSGMNAAKTALATTGHNISNANTEGYSRQRVELETAEPGKGRGNYVLGRGTNIKRLERINDSYLEKNIRKSARDLANLEEKDLMLNQLEDIFNEMNGDGLNRLLSRFFNEFRKLANDPDSEAVRMAVREASESLANDFHRIRNDIVSVQNHIDNRVEGYAGRVNALAEEIRDLNIKIKTMELGGAVANDLQDRRDLALKELSELVDVTMHTDKEGAYFVDIKGVGPLVSGPVTERLSVERSPADENGKPDNAYDIRTSASSSKVTHIIGGGKLGSLIEVRDQVLSASLQRLDDLAFNVARAVNTIHSQGFTRNGQTGVGYFADLTDRHRAAEQFKVSDAVKANVNNIATAAMPEAAGDNRVAIAISGLQNLRLMNEGKSTIDDFFNSMVGEVGTLRGKNTAALNQQKNIMGQLDKIREQISGVSLDEETANLLKFQHAFDASAKVMQVAGEMMDTVLNLKT